MNATLTPTYTTLPANKDLDRKESKLYYLIVETENGKHPINIGQKTYNKMMELIAIKTKK